MNQKQQHLILVVDDDESVTASLALLLKQNKFLVKQAHTPDSALAIINNESVSLVLQDMNFTRATTGKEGMQLLNDIRAINPQLPVILMTAWASISLAVEGMRSGANDFISKPWDNKSLIRTINTNIGLSDQQNNASSKKVLTRAQLAENFDFSDVVSDSPAMLDILNTISRICKTDASILILGESGTGKEVIADAIHKNSVRCQSSMIKVNLGGITPSLFESEMFGHVKGAFTDAKHDRLGRFSTADGSTLFLDEIGELDKSSQVKLLRVLQDQNFQMVGSSNNTSVNVRIISATNKVLEKMVEQDLFREDLFYRINLITLRLPPLRDRIDDIPLLAEHHLAKLTQLYNLPAAHLTASAVTWLQQQKWPGNVRQLCQSIERALLMSSKSELDYLDFIPESQAKSIQSSSDFDVGMVTLEQMEKLMIEKALVAYEGNISKVADSLGLSRAALYRRLDKHGINT